MLNAPTYLGHFETGANASDYDPIFTGGSSAVPQDDDPVILGVSWQEFDAGSVDDIVATGWGYTWETVILDQPSSYGNALIVGTGIYDSGAVLNVAFKSSGSPITLTRVGMTTVEWARVDADMLTGGSPNVDSGAVNATSIEAALASFAAGSATYCFATKSDHSNGMNPLGSLTEIDDLSDNEGRRFGSAYLLGEDTSPGWQVDSGGAVNWTVIGLEVPELTVPPTVRSVFPSPTTRRLRRRSGSR